MIWIVNLLAAVAVGVLLTELELSIIAVSAATAATFFLLTSFLYNSAVISAAYLDASKVNMFANGVLPFLNNSKIGRKDSEESE